MPGAALQTPPSLINLLINLVMICENILHYWFKSFGNFAKLVDFAHCTVEQYSLIKSKKYLLRQLNLGSKASLCQNGRF